MNIQNIAKEYKKLIGNKYIVGIENGETIRVSFTASDFYHLIGFKKFKDASIVRMIEDSAYNKRQFFNEVLKGNITFQETKIHIKNMEKYYVDGSWKELCEVEVDNNVSLVLNNRMPYFSFDNINLLIKGELVALFDKSKAPKWRKIDADKIFFRFLESEQKNLNFFIRKEEATDRDCPVSFFLETMLDEYLRAQAGRGELVQKKVQVTFRAIYSNGTEMNEFEVFWDKIRFYYSKYKLEEWFKGQKRLQEFFPSGTVVSSLLVEQLLNEKNQTLNDIIKELEEVEAEYEYKSKIDSYNKSADSEEKELLAIEIDEEFGIDIEKEPVNMQTDEIQNLDKKIQELKAKITVLNKQIKKCTKFIPELQKLEQEEIIYAYSEFIPEIKTYEEAFMMYLISELKIKENHVLPKEIKRIYRNYKGQPQKQVKIGK